MNQPFIDFLSANIAQGSTDSIKFFRNDSQGLRWYDTFFIQGGFLYYYTKCDDIDFSCSAFCLTLPQALEMVEGLQLVEVEKEK